MRKIKMKRHILMYQSKNPFSVADEITRLKGYFLNLFGFDTYFQTQAKLVAMPDDYSKNKQYLNEVADDDKEIFLSLLKSGFNIEESFYYLGLICESSNNSIFPKDYLLTSFFEIYRQNIVITENVIRLQSYIRASQPTQNFEKGCFTAKEINKVAKISNCKAFQ